MRRRQMQRRWIALPLTLLFSTPSLASQQFASAAMSPTSAFGGLSVSSSSYVGWRFSIDAPLLVQGVGGHLIGIHDAIFAAIVRLESIHDLPQGDPFADDEVVAHALISPTQPSAELVAEISQRLPPGAYALLFGSGAFEATGSAAVPNMASQPPIAPTGPGSFIRWQIRLPDAPPEWFVSPEGNMRFVVRGIELAGPADFSLDGSVDRSDLNVWAAHFGAAPGATFASGDADDDTLAGGSDFLAWQRFFGAAASAGAIAVPAPTTFSLTLLVLGWARTRRGGRESKAHA